MTGFNDAKLFSILRFRGLKDADSYGKLPSVPGTAAELSWLRCPLTSQDPGRDNAAARSAQIGTQRRPPWRLLVFHLRGATRTRSPPRWQPDGLERADPAAACRDHGHEQDLARRLARAGRRRTSRPVYAAYASQASGPRVRKPTPEPVSCSWSRTCTSASSTLTPANTTASSSSTPKTPDRAGCNPVHRDPARPIGIGTGRRG